MPGIVIFKKKCRFEKLCKPTNIWLPKCGHGLTSFLCFFVHFVLVTLSWLSNRGMCYFAILFVLNIISFRFVSLYSVSLSPSFFTSRILCSHAPSLLQGHDPGHPEHVLPLRGVHRVGGKHHPHPHHDPAQARAVFGRPHRVTELFSALFVCHRTKRHIRCWVTERYGTGGKAR